MWRVFCNEARCNVKNICIMKQTTICVASLLGGMILGSALAMLLTPQSGPELRNNLREAFDREIHKMKEEIEKARCHCNEKTE